MSIPISGIGRQHQNVPCLTVNVNPQPQSETIFSYSVNTTAVCGLLKLLAHHQLSETAYSMHITVAVQQSCQPLKYLFRTFS
jgi:hypothetical protein